MTYEHSAREFFETGRITDNYSIKEYFKFLDFARFFYPCIYDDLIDYDYFGSYHY